MASDLLKWWGNRYGAAVPRPHNAQVLSEKNVAGRPLKYSAESMAGCDTTIPALGSALSFFSGLPVFFVFPGSAQADASLSYVITSRGGF